MIHSPVPPGGGTFLHVSTTAIDTARHDTAVSHPPWEEEKKKSILRGVTYIIKCCNPFILNTTDMNASSIFRRPPCDFCSSKHWAPVLFCFTYTHFFVVEWWNTGSFGSKAPVCLCANWPREFRCCSTALLGGNTWYCVCLIREWEDLNPRRFGTGWTEDREGGFKD